MAKRRGESHSAAASGTVVIHGPGRDGHAEHLFEANRLGGELQIIVLALSPRPVLVFDGQGHAVVELDDIGLTDQADGLSVGEATELALTTWDREPLFHVSSPKDGWAAPNPRLHADYIDPADFPIEWLRLTLTVDVEAQAKERAVLDLRRNLEPASESLRAPTNASPAQRFP